MPQIKPVQTFKPAVEAAAASQVKLEAPTQQPLDQLLEKLKQEPNAERNWSIERFQHDLSKQDPQTANLMHQNLLSKIDSLEKQGIKSRKAPGDGGELYGILMDLYHASRGIRDSFYSAGQSLGKAVTNIPLTDDSVKGRN